MRALLDPDRRHSGHFVAATRCHPFALIDTYYDIAAFLYPASTHSSSIAEITFYPGLHLRRNSNGKAYSHIIFLRTTPLPKIQNPKPKTQ